MKKTLIMATLTVLIGILSGCGWREKLLAPPDEYTVPENSKVAECDDNGDVHKYIYKDDGIYLYYINDIEQDESSLDIILEEAYAHDNSVENYLRDIYPSSCTFFDYVPEND